eukprot:5654445-Pyramimonas_sp.AAC.1
MSSGHLEGCDSIRALGISRFKTGRRTFFGTRAHASQTFPRGLFLMVPERGFPDACCVREKQPWYEGDGAPSEVCLVCTDSGL